MYPSQPTYVKALYYILFLFNPHFGNVTFPFIVCKLTVFNFRRNKYSLTRAKCVLLKVNVFNRKIRHLTPNFYTYIL